MEPSRKILSSAWYSKLWITTGAHLAFCRDEFCEPRSDIVRQAMRVRCAFKQGYVYHAAENQDSSKRRNGDIPEFRVVIA
ncbi:hypothetical protein TNCV_1150941 [Trichonephila clavipes]|nr:hypothetical protein TNCV_1150941 [Trichonephila clavipes]